MLNQGRVGRLETEDANGIFLIFFSENFSEVMKKEEIKTGRLMEG